MLFHWYRFTIDQEGNKNPYFLGTYLYDSYVFHGLCYLIYESRSRSKILKSFWIHSSIQLSNTLHGSNGVHSHQKRSNQKTQTQNDPLILWRSGHCWRIYLFPGALFVPIILRITEYFTKGVLLPHAN